MKKFLGKTTVLTALAVVFMTATAAAAEIGTGVVHADALRLRQEPSLSASTITCLQDGTKLSVHEQMDGWFKVVYNNRTGYVSSDYVAYTSAPVVQVSVENENIGKTVVNADHVNFRVKPSTDAEVISKLSKDATVELISTADGWCEVVSGGQVGYVSADYISVDGIAVQNARGMVTGSCVNVRSQPTTGAGIVTKIYAGSVIDLLALNNNWYTISYNGTTGYVCADYIRQYTASEASTIGEEVAALALGYLGTPYVYGGESPKGFDCSGFTRYVYKQFGYDLPHSATSQWFNSGTYVERADLQPGDLVLFCDPSRSNGKACSHVGVYIGDNEFVHASSGSSGKYVRISSLTEGYYSRYYKGAKR